MVPALAGSAANGTLCLALGAAALVSWVMFRTRAGFEVRAIGLASEAARVAGMQVARIRFWTFVMSGVLAGLGGANFALGYKRYYEDGFAGGAGFLGIAVAIAGGSHPLAVVLAALGFATLAQGGLAIHAVVPKQMADILAATVMLAVTAAAPRARALLAAGIGWPQSPREPQKDSRAEAPLPVVGQAT
jgi:simple sugar transport system permease protein